MMVDLQPTRRTTDLPRRRLRKGMYLLPSLFTAGNVAAGFWAIVLTLQGSNGDYGKLDFAAVLIGWAILFDGLDGRIARMTNTSSDFGREFDSLADAITFGVAPALLAWVWGFKFLPSLNGAQLPAWLVGDGGTDPAHRLSQLGIGACFIFLVCGASRLARFNIDKDPKPSNPGKPGRKYFVGMPIPGGAGLIAAVVHFIGGRAIDSSWYWWLALVWGVFVVCIGLLMVSTWRFPSFKGIDLKSPHPFRTIIIVAAVIFGIAEYSRPVLLGIAMTYLFWGVGTRMAYAARRNPASSPLSEQSQS